ncbi:MAG: hypothetical protein A2W85_15000 [Bacteroidetes bacterium GWF2_41_31]|nr:MAG: hypothetical protein A2W85_15000 [Bacteroidetes bacterium GWF2_41_31]OFZ07865.1 MAG: hypothetical protein A2338_10460 [Bacteroidetes bacterium RIFOXYB12_FULL_41_6]
MINPKNTFFAKFAILLIVVFFANNLQAQKSITYFTDINGKECGESDASFKRTVNKSAGRWLVHDYYMNDTMQMRGTYLNKKLTIETDTFNYYRINGRLYYSVVYVNGLRDGDSKIYYPTGVLEQSIHYSKGKISGKTTFYDRNGYVEKEWLNADESTFNAFNSQATYHKGPQDFLYYMERMEYPKNDLTNDSIARMLVSFEITETGKVNDAEIILHGTKEMDAAVLNQLYNSPLWKPAIKKGQPASSRFIMPLHFNIPDNDGFIKTDINISNTKIANLLYNSGLNDYNEGNYDKAIFKLNSAISRNSIESRFYYLLGLCYYKQKQNDMACEYWDIAGSIDKEIIDDKIRELCK